MQVEEKYMMRCLELARLGLPFVSPNPMVGAVVVHKGRIIGEGYHRKYGEAHAEVNAIHSVEQPEWFPESTLYVNLEPCSHHGQTPPCVDLIIQKKIPRVVVGCLDPFPEVSGRGVEILRNAGVEVVVDTALKESKQLNRYFLTAHTHKRPFVILKWAQSRDGFIDCLRKDASQKPVQLSTPTTRRQVHKLRSEVSAIIVGTHTALLDNPSLTVRHWVGKSPVRILLDRSLKVPVTNHILDGSTQTLVFSEKHQENKKNIEYITLDFSTHVIPQILDVLYHKKLFSLLVEGGAHLHQSFIDTGVWDELQIETAPIYLREGIWAPKFDASQAGNCFQSNSWFSSGNDNQTKESIISVYSCKNFE